MRTRLVHLTPMPPRLETCHRNDEGIVILSEAKTKKGHRQGQPVLPCKQKWMNVSNFFVVAKS